MDIQTLWSLALLVPAAVLVAVAFATGSRRRTGWGLGLRDGGVAEFARGLLFALPFTAVFLVLMPVLGITRTEVGPASVISIGGIAIFFLLLFVVEEIVFRSLLMTGLGLVIGQLGSWIVTALLVAGAYLFAPATSPLAMVGAVITNLLHGLARWRTGRIWWGLGQRWFWNVALLSAGYLDSGYSIEASFLDQTLTGPVWATGGAFGVEAGVVGIAFLLLMLVAVSRFITGRRGPWTIEPRPAS